MDEPRRALTWEAMMLETVIQSPPPPPDGVASDSPWALLADALRKADSQGGMW